MKIRRIVMVLLLMSTTCVQGKKTLEWSQKDVELIFMHQIEEAVLDAIPQDEYGLRINKKIHDRNPESHALVRLIKAIHDGVVPKAKQNSRFSSNYGKAARMISQLILQLEFYHRQKNKELSDEENTFLKKVHQYLIHATNKINAALNEQIANFGGATEITKTGALKLRRTIRNLSRKLNDTFSHQYGAIGNLSQILGHLDVLLNPRYYPISGLKSRLSYAGHRGLDLIKEGLSHRDIKRFGPALTLMLAAWGAHKAIQSKRKYGYFMPYAIMHRDEKMRHGKKYQLRETPESSRSPAQIEKRRTLILNELANYSMASRYQEAEMTKERWAAWLADPEKTGALSENEIKRVLSKAGQLAQYNPINDVHLSYALVLAHIGE